MRPFDRKVFAEIQAAGGRISTDILRDKLNETHWLRRWLPEDSKFLDHFPFLGAVYASLERLEKRGLVRGEAGQVRYPERGDRRRRYYQIVR